MTSITLDEGESSPTHSSIIRLAENTYVVVVHKLHADRVVDFLRSEARDDDPNEDEKEDGTTLKSGVTGTDDTKKKNEKTRSGWRSCSRPTPQLRPTLAMQYHPETTTCTRRPGSTSDGADATRRSLKISKDENHNPDDHDDDRTNTVGTTAMVNTADRPRVLDVWAADKGVSQSRRGYFLVLVPSIQKPMSSLKPIARANISWVGLITHQCTFRGKNRQEQPAREEELQRNHDSESRITSSADEAENEQMMLLGKYLWQTCQAQGLLASASSSSSSSSDQEHHHHQKLRVECHPRAMVEPVCLALQTAAAMSSSSSASKEDNLPVDPFDGPIPMTMSRTKCTHKLTVVVIRRDGDNNNNNNNNNTSTPTAPDSNETLSAAARDSDKSSSCSYDCYWGLEENNSNAAPMLRLNQEASREVVIHPCDHETGLERKNDDDNKLPAKKVLKVDPSLVLSRAYYKLDQVVTDILQPLTAYYYSQLQQGVGMDLGASPGGWTQILAHVVGMQLVVAVDPAKLATRVTQLANVRHLATSMETADYSLTAATATTAATAAAAAAVVNNNNENSSGVSYSMLVCDASILWFKLFEQFKQHVLPRATWSLPCIWVVTLKLPFKSPGSVERQTRCIYQEIPGILRDMAAVMYANKTDKNSNKSAAVEPVFQIAHLMANADSERTLIAIFDEKESLVRSGLL